MKQKISILIFALFLMLSFGSVEKVLACVCAEMELWCHFHYGINKIFIGKTFEKETILKKVEIENKIFTIEVNQYKIRVNKTFSDIKEDSIIVLIGDGTTCDIDLKLNEEYLIWAYKTENGKLMTDICTPTKLLVEAKKELNYLESVNSNQEPIRECKRDSDKNVLSSIKSYRFNIVDILFPDTTLAINETFQNRRS